MNDFLQGVFQGAISLIVLVSVGVFIFFIYILYQFGVFDSQKELHEKKYRERLKWFDETKIKATLEKPDPESVLLYSMYLNSDKARKQLKLKITPEKAKKQADILFIKAKALNAYSIKMHEAKLNLISNIYQSENSNNKALLPQQVKQVEKSLDSMAEVLKHHCRVLNPESDFPFHKWHVSVFRNQFISDITNYSHLQYKINSIKLRNFIHCDYSGDREDIIRNYILDKKDNDILSFHTDVQKLAFLSVLANMTAQPAIVKVIEKDINDNYQENKLSFKQYKEQILLSYDKYFGKIVPEDAEK